MLVAQAPTRVTEARANQKREFVAYLMRMTPQDGARYSQLRARIPALKSRMTARERAGGTYYEGVLEELKAG
ncbi:MAG TPA: hypothetical protein VEU96_03310 [Bryobacteraceae bacterium]|nr:hypothetical protein [Bryobacteraceae bacterium]